mgnify:CR=1 FL=1
MKNFIRELRRREVFRTAGLYVGVCWILIEVASVLLPTFEAPEWVLRIIIIAAVVGFPVMLVLAWVYDLTARGIEVQADPTDTVVAPFGGRKMDFVVIGVLSVALILSVYFNLTRGPTITDEPAPLSILIADFSNDTGNPLFDGLLEQALNVGVESAPHITAYQRQDAIALAERLKPGTAALDASVASLVAMREGIRLVLAGSIQSAGSGYELQVEGVNPSDFTRVFRVDRRAGSADLILQVVGELSREVREELGDTTLDSDTSPIAETFTAASLEAAKAYTTALQLAYDGNHDDAVEQYRTATELDPNFGRAFSGWALSEFKLGRTEFATELWQKALSLMETMTERERLRTLGLYYATVTGNFENAVQSFSELVDKYPADAAGLNNFAVSAFLTLDFAVATEAGRRLLEIYPASQLYRSNYALYAMYSGDFAAAAKVARDLIADHPGYGTSYLPLAISHLANGEFGAARDAYRQMAAAQTSEHRDSLATLGLADIAIYTGDFTAAEELLASGIEADVAADNRRAAAVKWLARAQGRTAAGQPETAADAAREALALSSSDAVQVGAALVLLEAGDVAAAKAIGDALASKLQSQSRAYGAMIQGAVARAQGNYAAAVDLLRSGIGHADLWLIRFELGRTYLDAGFFAEAEGEFIQLQARIGEAAAVFLDDMPTWRLTAPLPYWTARAEEALGMRTSATQGFETFLALRPNGGALADDARQRLE